MKNKLNKSYFEQITKDCLYKNMVDKYINEENFDDFLIKSGCIEEFLTEVDKDAIKDLDLLTMPIIDFKQEYDKNNQAKKLAIVISTGSFSPMHDGHVDAMELAKKYIENTLGYQVIQGVMSLSHDGYVSIKNNGIAKLHVGERTHLAYEKLKNKDWITIDRFEGEYVSVPINFSTVIERVRNYIIRHNKNVNLDLKVFYVFGADNASFSYAFINNDNYNSICVQRGKYDYSEVKNSLKDNLNIHFIENDTLTINHSSTEIRKKKIDSEKRIGKNKIYFIRTDDVSLEFCNALKDVIKNYINEEVEIRFISSQNFELNDYEKTISLDKYVKAKYNLDLSRIFALSDIQFNAFGMISLTENIESQINKIPKGEYILFDDDSVSGYTFRKVEEILNKNGIDVIKKEILVSSFIDESIEEIYDIIDARDFVINHLKGGLVVEDFEGAHIRVPYIAPFVNLTTRANILPKYQIEVSKKILEINGKYNLESNINIPSFKSHVSINSDFIKKYYGYFNNYLKVNTIIEYGHIYVDELIKNNISLKNLRKEIDLALDITSTMSKFKGVVLIDDKNHSLTDKEKINISKYVQSLYEQFGLKPEELFFEKDFENLANEILKLIPLHKLKNEYFKKSKKTVTFLNTNGKLIPLKESYEGYEKYTCCMLSASWLVYKKDNICNSEDRTLTILDKKYEKVEFQVQEILKASGYKEYYFSDNAYIWF